MARLALAEKASVAIASSSQEKVQNAVNRLQALYPQANISGHVIDITSGDLSGDVDKLLREVTANGPLDHIVNTANRINPKPFADIDRDHFDHVAGLTLFVPTVLGQLAPKFLKSDNTSSLTFTSGRIAIRPRPNAALYGAVAAGVLNIARGLAIDMPPVRVNVVCPGWTDTEMYPEGPAKEYFDTMSVKDTLLGKGAMPEEVAEAYIYLMKNTNATGTVITSDGGASLK